MNDKASMSELLQWLAGGPRTYDWSAVLAYDRDRTNVVLRQEYIERFDAGSHLPPATQLIPTTDETAEYVYDYVFDAARLSFINASLDNSRAMLSQQVIGGAQLSLSRSALGATQVEKIFSLDALDGPRLESGVLLAESTGYVDLTGKVVLDIATGVLPRLVFAGSEAEREACGIHLQRDFAGLEPELRMIVLNELLPGSGHFLQPVSFRIRTHAAPNTHVRGTPAYGAGAVLLFITLYGDSDGTSPVRDDDMPFLIPAGHSATLLMGHDFFIRQIIPRAARAICNVGVDFRYELVREPNGRIREMHVTNAITTLHEMSGPSLFYDYIWIKELGLDLVDSGSTYRLFFDNEGVSLRMLGAHPLYMEVKPRNAAGRNGQAQAMWHLRQDFKLLVDPATGVVGLSPVAGESFLNVFVIAGDFASYPPVNDNFLEVAQFGHASLRALLDRLIQSIVETSTAVDAFRRTSVLFRGDNAVTLHSAHQPCDLALFGDVSPALNDFIVDPLEPLMGPGQSQPFSVSPPRSGITWSLHGLPGENGALGSISADGVYTAPKLGEISGYQVRIRVRATLGQHTSTALVTVVVRDITVNPVVQVCDTRQVRYLSAGTLGGGQLTWSIANPASGSSIANTPDPEGFHLYRPGALESFSPFRVDEIVVGNDLSGNRQSAWVLVIGGTPSLEIRYVEVPGQPDQVQCTAYFAINGQPADPASLRWQLIVGAGHIDDKGLFTLDRNGQLRFAVVTCEIPMPPPLPSYSGFCILPLPLVVLPELMQVLDAAAASFAGHAGSAQA